jgi:hypothetical protein
MGHFLSDKTFASDLYLIYKLSPSARVCISDADRLLMFYLLLIIILINYHDMLIWPPRNESQLEHSHSQDYSAIGLIMTKS